MSYKKNKVTFSQIVEIETKNGIIKLDIDSYIKIKEEGWVFTVYKSPQKSGTYYLQVRIQKRDSPKENMYYHILSRYLLKAPRNKDIDHRDRDSLNNTLKNLRLVNKSQNQMNARKGNISGFKGVYWHKHTGRWTAAATHKRKKHFLGYFKDRFEAAKAYDKKAQELFGEYALLNFPNEIK